MEEVFETFYKKINQIFTDQIRSPYCLQLGWWFVVVGSVG